MKQSNTTWESVPGVFQLIEAGADPSDLGGKDFIHPDMRGGSLRWERLWLWLRGFRREDTLCERMAIWVPIATLWPAPEGQIKFSYATSGESEKVAEVTLASVVGFGSGSRLKLTQSVTLDAQDSGLAYRTRAFLTIIRYRNPDSGEEILRTDVDCAGEYPEFESLLLAAAAHPFSQEPTTVENISALKYRIRRLERCTPLNTATLVKDAQESECRWKVKLTPTIPLLESPITLEATCKRGETFTTEFSLPQGRDYALCAPEDESPVASICVVLK